MKQRVTEREREREREREGGRGEKEWREKNKSFQAGAAGSGSSSSWDGGQDTQVVENDVMDELAEKFRRANAAIDLASKDDPLGSDEPGLVDRLHTALKSQAI